MVGIDAYFPLTDTTSNRISLEEIRHGWQKGEGTDYYYVKDEKDVKGEKRIYSQDEPWNQWKNLEYWWNSEHWVGNNKTAWVPKMKPIWFTEYGFPSVDKSPNQPNVFFDLLSVEGVFPINSLGKVDFEIQRKSILATLEFCSESGFIENIFYWCWDARSVGWPFTGKFADGYKWNTGHWLDGKIGCKQPLYIGPTLQNNLSVISAYSDIDVIPNVHTKGALNLFAKKIKIRDDMVIEGMNHLKFKKEAAKCENIYEFYQQMDELWRVTLANFNNKSQILASKCKILCDQYIVITAKYIFGGVEEDINEQPYSPENIGLCEEYVALLN